MPHRVECRLPKRYGRSASRLDGSDEPFGLGLGARCACFGPGGGDFGTSDEWRHYNALYFPYVAGLKPYSSRATHDHLDADARAALDWFRTAVPERTLHNWQNAAAKLIAQDLRARHAALPD